MKYFDIIAEIHHPSPEVQPCKQTSRDTDDQIPEDVTLTKYLKRRKVKRKWLNKFWVILIYKKKINAFFLCFMNECFTELFTDIFFSAID